MADFNPDRHLPEPLRSPLVGGFGLLLVVGGAFAAFFLGGGAALVAISVLLGAGLLAGLIYLVLNGLERLAR